MSAAGWLAANVPLSPRSPLFVFFLSTLRRRLMNEAAGSFAISEEECERIGGHCFKRTGEVFSAYPRWPN